MEKEIIFNTKLVFADVFKLKTNTEYRTDGTILITPIGWDAEDLKIRTTSGKPVKISGHAEVELNGKTTFVPTKRTFKGRYTTLYRDRIVEIRETKRDYIFIFRAPKSSFENTEKVKPLLDELEWLKKYIKKNIKARVEHDRKQSKL